MPSPDSPSAHRRCRPARGNRAPARSGEEPDAEEDDDNEAEPLQARAEPGSVPRVTPAIERRIDGASVERRSFPTTSGASTRAAWVTTSAPCRCTRARARPRRPRRSARRRSRAARRSTSAPAAMRPRRTPAGGASPMSWRTRSSSGRASCRDSLPGPCWSRRRSTRLPEPPPAARRMRPPQRSSRRCGPIRWTVRRYERSSAKSRRAAAHGRARAGPLAARTGPADAARRVLGESREQEAGAPDDGAASGGPGAAEAMPEPAAHPAARPPPAPGAAEAAARDARPVASPSAVRRSPPRPRLLRGLRRSAGRQPPLARERRCSTAAANRRAGAQPARGGRGEQSGVRRRGCRCR